MAERSRAEAPGLNVNNRTSPFSLADFVQMSCISKRSVHLLAFHNKEIIGGIVIEQGEIWRAWDAHGEGEMAFRRLAMRQVDVHARPLTARQPRDVFGTWEQLLLQAAVEHDELTYSDPVPAPPSDSSKDSGSSQTRSRVRPSLIPTASHPPASARYSMAVGASLNPPTPPGDSGARRRPRSSDVTSDRPTRATPRHQHSSRPQRPTVDSLTMPEELETAGSRLVTPRPPSLQRPDESERPTVPAPATSRPGLRSLQDLIDEEQAAASTRNSTGYTSTPLPEAQNDLLEPEPHTPRATILPGPSEPPPVANSFLHIALRWRWKAVVASALFGAVVGGVFWELNQQRGTEEIAQAALVPSAPNPGTLKVNGAQFSAPVSQLDAIVIELPEPAAPTPEAGESLNAPATPLPSAETDVNSKTAQSADGLNDADGLKGADGLNNAVPSSSPRSPGDALAATSAVQQPSADTETATPNTTTATSNENTSHNAPTRVAEKTNVVISGMATDAASSADELASAIAKRRGGFRNCHTLATARADRNWYGKVRVRVAFDPSGLAIASSAVGAGLPGLDTCIASVAGQLRGPVSTPDDKTATVRAAGVSWTIEFWR